MEIISCRLRLGYLKIRDPENEILPCQYACAYKPLKHGNPIINRCVYFANNAPYNACSIVKVISYVESNIDLNMMNFIFNRNIIDQGECFGMKN